MTALLLYALQLGILQDPQLGSPIVPAPAPAEHGPSPILLPAQQIPLRFSHRSHLARKIACDYCHEKAPESTSARDFLIPPEEACTDCHAIDRSQPEKKAKVPARCDACHPGWQGQGQPARVVVPEPHLKFNHKIHVSRAIQCIQCHENMREVDLATRAQLPRMPLCLRCHVGGTKAPSRCGTCHLLTAAGTLQTQYNEGRLVPSGTLRGDEHTPNFRRDHANVARNDEGYCLNCHRKDECLSCHNGVTKPMDIHGNDYVSIHPVEARRDSLRCQACHRFQTFCVGCHQRSGIAYDPPGGTGPSTSSLRFHPSSWVTGIGSMATNPNHHGWQAQRNVRACVSCHREETCVNCHSTFGTASGGSLGTNPKADPHPPNWQGSGKCKAIVARNKRVCLKCHPASSPCASSCDPTANDCRNSDI